MAWKEKTKGFDDGAEAFKFEAVGDSIEGYLKNVGSITFDGKAVKRYLVQTDDGLYSFLGSFKIDELMTGIETGIKVRLTYTKKERLGGGKTLKQFKLETNDEDRIEV